MVGTNPATVTGPALSDGVRGLLLDRRGEPNLAQSSAGCVGDGMAGRLPGSGAEGPPDLPSRLRHAGKYRSSAGW